MEEMLEGEGPEQTDNPRLQAILELIKFLSKSETSRAMPQAPAPMLAGPEAPVDEGSPDEDELEALKALAR